MQDAVLGKGLIPGKPINPSSITDPTTLKQNKFLGPAASDYTSSSASSTASLLGQKEMMQYNSKFFKLSSQAHANNNTQESLSEKEIQRNRR